MIWFYRLLFLPLLILSLPYYGWRMFRRGGYRHDFHHRFGLIDRPRPKQAGVARVWIQAVSVGELKAIAPLIEGLNNSGRVEIVLTTTTSTGYQLAGQLYAGEVLKLGIFPLDFFPFSRSAWRRLNPDMAILMESELWPEHMRQARQRGVPVMLVNARMSDRSFRRYQRMPFLACWLLRQPSQILAGSELDAERLLQLGAMREKVLATGNLKFDVTLDTVLSARERGVLKEELGLESRIKETRSPLRPPLILLGSSTWPGEEALLLELLETALQEGINLRLLVVPRHAERRGEIRALLEKQPRSWHMRSEGTSPARPVRIYVADTTGELAFLSQVADIAFIGKSMPPNRGGQTPIEAASLGLPIVYGPDMSNFRQACQTLEEVGAAVRVKATDTFSEVLLELLRDGPRRAAMSAAGQAWHRANQGACQRNCREILMRIAEVP